MSRNQPTDRVRPRALRICHLAYTFYEADNRVMRYAQALADRGDEVDVIALRRPSQSTAGSLRGVRVSRIQRRTVNERFPGTYLVKILLFLMQAAILLTVRHLRRPYDVLHIHNVPDFLVFAATVPRLLGARVILDIHDVLPELYAGKFMSGERSLPFRLLLLVERVSCRFAHHVIVANDIWRERLIERAVPAANCSAFLNYPDLQIFAPASRGERTDDSYVMLYPGSLNRHQGLDVAVRAFAIVADRMPNAKFHIYGEGPARPELQRIAAGLGFADRIRLMDPLPLDQIAGVMAAADLGVEPKRAEGFANEALSTKILEFMACRVPVVVSRTAAHARYFNESVVSFFQPGNEHALAEAMLDEYRSNGSRAARLEAGTVFAKRYSWQERRHEYLQLVDGLATAASAPQRQAAGSQS